MSRYERKKCNVCKRITLHVKNKCNDCTIRSVKGQPKPDDLHIVSPGYGLPVEELDGIDFSDYNQVSTEMLGDDN